MKPPTCRNRVNREFAYSCADEDSKKKLRRAFAISFSFYEHEIRRK